MPIYSTAVQTQTHQRWNEYSRDEMDIQILDGYPQTKWVPCLILISNFFKPFMHCVLSSTSPRNDVSCIYLQNLYDTLTLLGQTWLKLTKKSKPIHYMYSGAGRFG